MKRIKAFVALALIVSLIVSMSGCNFRFSSFDNLLRPPKLSGKYQVLQDSFEKLVDKDYCFLTPENGSYRSAFIVNDFDLDGDEEAIVFYTEKKNQDLVKVYYFEYKENDWAPVGSYDGLGSSIDEVKLADLNQDGKTEIIIGWNLFSSKTNKMFAVYDISGGSFKLVFSSSYSSMSIFDVNGDGIEDIFAMCVDSSVAEQNLATATAYSYDVKSGTLYSISSVRTDGNISSYAEIKTEKIDDCKLIYIEAYKGDNDMITEIVYWDDETNSLVAPLFDVATQTTTATLRHSRLFCCDIDSDGYLEIPVSVDMPGSSIVDSSLPALSQSGSEGEVSLTKSLYYTKWVKLRDGKLRAVEYSVIDESSGYYLAVPSSWVGRITVLGNDGQWDYYHWNSYENKLGSLLFSIYYYDKNNAEAEKSYKALKLLTSYSSTNYVYAITDEGYNFGVDDETIKDNFNATVLGGMQK